MSVAFASGAAAPRGGVAQGALQNAGPLIGSTLAPSRPAQLRGANTTRTEPSNSVLACGAAAGVAVASLKGMRRQARQHRHTRAAQLVNVVEHEKVAEDDELETLPSKDKSADGSISLGQEVTWNGKQGTVRYIGEVQFTGGEWIGLELTEGVGMHDGTVMGIPYFKCAAKRGVFTEAVQLVRGNASPVTVPEAAPVVVPVSVTVEAPEGEGPVARSREKVTNGSISLGQEVRWSGRKGVVRYIGDVKFAQGEWIGLELTEAKGMHDGNVMGTSYFECAPRHGVFAHVDQLEVSAADPVAPTVVTDVAPEMAPAPKEQVYTPPPSQEKTADGSISLRQEVMWSGRKGVVQYIGDVRFAEGEWVGVELMEAKGMNDGNVLGVAYFDCAPKHGIFAQAVQLSCSSTSPSGVPATSSQTVSASKEPVAAPASVASSAPVAAEEPERERPSTHPSQEKTADGSISLGQEVTWKDEQGIVRYIGEVKFAAGEWVGLELMEAAGIHDGHVMGIAYFECAPKRGVFAQASQLDAGAVTPVAAPEATSSAASASSTDVVVPVPVASASPETEGLVTLPSKEKTDDGSISLGQEVVWSGKQGVVRYIGDVKFAKGEWIGLELTEAKGMHDGHVMGTAYFECAPKHGIFTQADNLSGKSTPPIATPSESAPAASASDAPVAPPKPLAAAVPQEEVAALPSDEKTADGSISLGQQVAWNGKPGIVRYIGGVKFASGEWVGLELEEAKGMHDGSVMGVPYFACAPKHGAFVQPGQLRPSDEPVAAPEPEEVTTLPSEERTRDGSISLGHTVIWNGKPGTVRYIGDVRFASGEWVGLELSEPTGMHDGTVMHVPYFACKAKHGVFTQAAQLTIGGESPATASASSSTRPSEDKSADGRLWLGREVSWKGNPGTVRYIGKVDFGAGEWVGVEMKEAKGMHDGKVMGVQYFKCPAMTGVFLLPGQVQADHDPRVKARSRGHIETAALQTSDGRLWLGDEVTWKGKKGAVRYIGRVEFAEGEWVGVELVEAIGVHDGSVNGIQYFSCPPEMGIFLLPGQVYAAADKVLAGTSSRPLEGRAAIRQRLGCPIQ
mmetsp:Transcript_139387/g.347532  ORF Transcript_139387/g.347532 Transcript_139387/m.347532 type:complete len:1075 (-) Transcript_139387:636-3860(-)